MMRNLKMFGSVLGLAALGVVSHAAAQTTDANQPTQPQPTHAQPKQQQPQYIYPSPRSPLGGVPSAAPRPTSLPQVSPQVGVPSNGSGRVIPIIPPPAYQTQPIPVSNPPATPVIGNNADNTRSNLVRRLLDARYGPGYSVVDGRLVYDQKRANMAGWSGTNVNAGGWVTPAVNPIDGTIRGIYNSNDFRLGFSLGNNFPSINYRSDYSYGKYPARLYRSYYSGYEDWDRLRNSCTGYDNPYLVVGRDCGPYVVDPRLTAQTDTGGVPVRELTALEKAEIALKMGDAAEASRQLKLHLRELPDDAGVERLLAMSLIDDRKVEQGVAVLLHAYMKQPQLAADALDPRILSGGELEHRRRFGAVMDYANRVKTGASYFAASVLAQSEGRFDVASKMLDKAIATGLDKKVAEEMKVGIANK